MSEAPVILFVEDEILFWDMYRSFFTVKGYELRFAADGHAGITLVRKERVDLVVMDLAMPGVDGELSIEVLREQWPKLPVIILSGFVKSEQLESGVPGVRKILQKPVNLNQLHAAIREVLAQDTR